MKRWLVWSGALLVLAGLEASLRGLIGPYAYQIVVLVGVNGMNALTKVMGFLILCIGVQFIVNGVLGVATDPAVVRAIRDAAVGR